MRDPFQQHLQPQRVREVSLVAKDKIDLSGVKFVTRNHCKIFVLKRGNCTTYDEGTLFLCFKTRARGQDHGRFILITMLTFLLYSSVTNLN